MSFSIHFSAYSYGAGLVGFGPWDEKGEDAVAVLGLDPIGVDLHWHRQGAVKRAREAFAPMEANTVRVCERLLSRDSDRPVLDLDFQITLVDTWNLQNGDEIVALLEDIDRRKRARSASSPSQPIAVEAGLEGSLEIKQRIEWVVHGRPPCILEARACPRTSYASIRPHGFGRHDAEGETSCLTSFKRPESCPLEAPASGGDLGRALALSRGSAKKILAPLLNARRA